MPPRSVPFEQSKRNTLVRLEQYSFFYRYNRPRNIRKFRRFPDQEAAIGRELATDKR